MVPIVASCYSNPRHEMQGMRASTYLAAPRQVRGMAGDSDAAPHLIYL